MVVPSGAPAPRVWPPIVFPDRHVTRARSIATLLFAYGVLTGAPACRTDRRDAKPDKPAAASAASEVAEVAEDAGVDTRALAAARRAVNAAQAPAIAFAAVSRTAVVTSGAVGFADDTTRAAATGDTVFHAASIGKLIVATCVMQLVEDKKLDLDHDVSTYVGFVVRHPRFPKTVITLRMLLAHRASIHDRVDELRAASSDRPLGPFLRAYLDGAGHDAAAPAFLAAAPDTSTAYSNVGAALAALAVEQVSHEPFARLSARRVFAPLGMTTARWSASRGATPATGSAATPHVHRRARFSPLPHASHAVYPAADLYASARDLARFTRAVLSGGALDGARVLAERSVTTMLGSADGERPLAWQLRTIGGAALAGHEGEDDGASTALFLDVATGTGAVVLANADAFASGDAARAAAFPALITELLTIARCR